jgi:hypothetical protein
MNRKGEIAMTRATWERMGTPKAFSLMFDTVNNRIGLKPAALATRNAYPVCISSALGGKRVHARRLMKEFKIELPETVRFYDADTDEDGVLILDLRTARVSPKARNHWRRKAVMGDE